VGYVYDTRLYFRTLIACISRLDKKEVDRDHTETAASDAQKKKGVRDVVDYLLEGMYRL